jgi:carboxymethylenebutenolidase
MQEQREPAMQRESRHPVETRASATDRRGFLWRSGGGAAALLAAAANPLASGSARAALVAPDDQRLVVQEIRFPGASGMVPAYLARPAAAGAGRLPAVIVVHENRGLDGHIQDVARRTALAGFMAIAPDLLSPAGGTPDDPKAARELLNGMDTDPLLADLVATLVTTRMRGDCSGSVGAVGFGWGGGMVNRLATVAHSLDAGVVFYGRIPRADEVERIRTPLLLHYGALDTKLDEGLPAFEEGLKAAKVDYTLNVYPGVNQSFNNDTSRSRYNAQAATLAWDRTVAFLKRTLG